MLLAIDIGNTSISFGIFDGFRMLKGFDMPRQAYTPMILKKKLGKLRPASALISSVVPLGTGVLVKSLKKNLGINCLIIGKDIPVPIKNLYRKPKQVGNDRLVNAYAAVKLYGAPLVAIDFGTAITFDVISKNKEYLGGMILPGLKISLDALAERTALLPTIKLKTPKELVGRDTESSMLSGVVYGFAAMADDLAMRIKKKIGNKALVIGTGGNIGLIGRYCRRLDIIDKNLTLKGINLIYNNNR